MCQYNNIYKRKKKKVQTEGNNYSAAGKHGNYCTIYINEQRVDTLAA